MKDYKKSEIELVELDEKDVITTSIGVETTPKDNGDGNWEFS